MGDILLPFSDLWTEFPLHGSIPMFARIHALGGDGRPNEDEGGLIGVVRFRILSFDLRDLDGNPIPNLPYRSESGTRYFGDQNYVPEPGTASLLLVSVGLLAGLGFVKHRTMGDQRAARMSG